MNMMFMSCFKSGTSSLEHPRARNYQLWVPGCLGYRPVPGMYQICPGASNRKIQRNRGSMDWFFFLPWNMGFSWNQSIERFIHTVFLWWSPKQIGCRGCPEVTSRRRSSAAPCGGCFRARGDNPWRFERQHGRKPDLAIVKLPFIDDARMMVRRF